MGVGDIVGGMVAGAVAVVCGVVLAGVTAFGVVSTVSEHPRQPETSIVEYGTNASE